MYKSSGICPHICPRVLGSGEGRLLTAWLTQVLSVSEFLTFFHLNGTISQNEASSRCQQITRQVLHPRTWAYTCTTTHASARYIVRHWIILRQASAGSVTGHKLHYPVVVGATVVYFICFKHFQLSTFSVCCLYFTNRGLRVENDGLSFHLLTQMLILLNYFKKTWAHCSLLMWCCSGGVGANSPLDHIWSHWWRRWCDTQVGQAAHNAHIYMGDWLVLVTNENTHTQTHAHEFVLARTGGKMLINTQLFPPPKHNVG